MRGSRPEIDLLLLWLRGGLTADRASLDAAAQAMDEAAWARWPAAALRHELPFAAVAVHEALGRPLPAPLEAVVAGLRVMQLRALADLRVLVTLLDEPWALLKGPVLADAVWPRRGQRGYADLDVLVAPAALGRVLDRLESSGVQLLTRNWQMVERGRRAELSLLLPHGTELDLHWDPLGEPLRAPSVLWDVEAMLARTRSVTVGGGTHRVRVPTLDPEDTLATVAVHAVLDGLKTLKQVMDVAAAAAAAGPVAGPAALMVATATARAGSALGADLGHRAAGPWAALLRADGRMNPMTRRDRPLSMAILTAATRSSTRTSARALAGAVRGSVQQLAEPAHPWRRRPTAPPPNPLLQALDGGARARVIASLTRPAGYRT